MVKNVVKFNPLLEQAGAESDRVGEAGALQAVTSITMKIVDNISFIFVMGNSFRLLIMRYGEPETQVCALVEDPARYGIILLATQSCKSDGIPGAVKPCSVI